VLFMVSYILITGYSILLFMNPLNFKFLQVPAVLCHPVVEYLRFGQRNPSFSQLLGLGFFANVFLKIKNVWKIKKR